jgi:hypothetical protein
MRFYMREEGGVTESGDSASKAVRLSLPHQAAS